MGQTAHAATTSRSRAFGVALLVATSILWSLSGIFVKTVNIDSIAFAFWRSLAAGAAILPLIWLSRQPWPDLRWMLLSVVVYAAVVSLLITAMTDATAAVGILLQYTGPVFCALFAWIFQRRRIGGRTWLAIAIASGGILIMMLGGQFPRGWVGPVCGLLSGIAFGALILILEKLNRLAGGQANPFAIVAFNNLGCAILLVGVMLLLARPIMAMPWQVGMVLMCGVVQLGIPYVLFQLGLRRVPAVDASLLILLEPVLNPLWVWLAIGERPDAATFVGGAAILIAMSLEATNPDAR
ncbi:DMT family transporter [Fontivita pretiosa]|uniref:DMT family transporter n=1 Tax=Fontivita pretiosa TaxID=2989684 RepID=UPI003D16F99C